jgi:HSP20 family protein
LYDGRVTGSSIEGAAELAEDARKLLAEIEREVPGAAALAAECRPPIDVLETATAVEVVIDLPGVPADSIRIAIRRQTLLVVGAKCATSADRQSRFHVAERSYGRFARAVRLSVPVDAARAEAITERGLLRVLLPRIDDRRGRLFSIPVTRR